MKIVMFFSGLMTALAISAQTIPITVINVTGANNPAGNLTITAPIPGAGDGVMANCEIKSTNGLICTLIAPSAITEGTWTDTSWTPYFTGAFIITVAAWDTNYNFWGGSTTVTVTRTVSGIINSVQVADSTNYDANGPWENIEVSDVMLNNTGLMSVGDADSIGCNLLNAHPTITNGMTEEQQDIAFADTVGYAPAGTPFRFDMFLHARPTSFMGMGEMKRFVWTPVSAAAPNGPGRLVVDITSCSPWRNTYSTNFQADVGFAPLFVTDTNMAAQMEGILMCTSAHFLDVAPTNSATDSRLGLIVNGHSNTTSYLKAFIPDTMLATFGVTNVAMASNMLTGYVTHFNAAGASEGNAVNVPPTFTRIPGGTNIVYAYNSGTNGDSGYEARFNFVFHSPVAAEMGPVIVPNDVLRVVCSDFDGDGKADPALQLETSGKWQILLSGQNYAPTPLSFGGAGWIPSAADFDGDGYADPMIYNAASGTMRVQLSGQSYVTRSATGLGGAGYHTILGDFDGDRKADPAVNQAASGTFFIQRSLYNYAPAACSGFGNTNYIQVDGDFDGDRKADLAVYNITTGHWWFLISSKGYLGYDYSDFGDPGYTPVSGDFDGDRWSDPALYQASIGRWYFTLSDSHYLIRWLQNLGNSNSVAVSGDFDGDGTADPAVVDTTTGILTVALSGINHAKQSLQLIVPE